MNDDWESLLRAHRAAVSSYCEAVENLGRPALIPGYSDVHQTKPAYMVQMTGVVRRLPKGVVP